MSDSLVQAELIAVLVSVTAGQPKVLTIEGGYALPSGPLQTGHRSLQSGLRAWVEQQTGHPLGYVEQLYTFADQHSGARRGISISYLGLSREEKSSYPDALWRGWYDYFPWEDTRSPSAGLRSISVALNKWAGTSFSQKSRVAALFGKDDQGWNEELVLQRYELLWEAGLVPEAKHKTATDRQLATGEEMTHDHRRILATAIARLRSKIKYRPVMFELLPHEFTLLDLQQIMEALAGRIFHKSNFRRFIEQLDLIEETGRMAFGLTGRPAKLFRFRPAILAERSFAGTKLPIVK